MPGAEMMDHYASRSNQEQQVAIELFQISFTSHGRKLVDTLILPVGSGLSALVRISIALSVSIECGLELHEDRHAKRMWTIEHRRLMRSEPVTDS